MYTLRARIYPAALCAIPIFVLNYFLLHVYLGDFLNSILSIRWAGEVTIAVILTYFLAEIGRFIAKELYEKSYFKDELSMPTTDFLLHSDQTYTQEYKSQIHSKILSDFSMQVCSSQEEAADNEKARKIIVQCVSMIRGKVKDGRLILNHNIGYGFARNLIGGSVIAVAVSIVNLYIFGYFIPNMTAFWISLFLGLIYLTIMLSGKSIMSRYGIRYAKVLIQEYLLSA